MSQTNVASNTVLLRDVLRIPHVQNELLSSSANLSQNSFQNTDKVHYFFEADDYDPSKTLQEQISDPEERSNQNFEELFRKVFLSDASDDGESSDSSDDQISLEELEASMGNFSASVIINR